MITSSKRVPSAAGRYFNPSNHPLHVTIVVVTTCNELTVRLLKSLHYVDDVLLYEPSMNRAWTSRWWCESARVTNVVKSFTKLLLSHFTPPPLTRPDAHWLTDDKLFTWETNNISWSTACMIKIFVTLSGNFIKFFFEGKISFAWVLIVWITLKSIIKSIFHWWKKNSVLMEKFERSCQALEGFSNTLEL